MSSIFLLLTPGYFCITQIKELQNKQTKRNWQMKFRINDKAHEGKEQKIFSSASADQLCDPGQANRPLGFTRLK